MSPLWLPHKGALQYKRDDSSGVTVTTGAGATAKGTPAVLFAATPFDAYWLTLFVFGLAASATASEAALDVLTGAATEDVLIPNLLAGYAGSVGTATPARRYDFPIYIPAGTRVTVQAASVRLSTGFTVKAQIMGGISAPYWPTFMKCATVGMGTVPNGTAITPGASNAVGTWTQIIAATTEDYFCAIPGFQVSADTTINDRWLTVDIGVGAATEEQIGEQWIWATDAAEGMGGPFMGFPVYDDIPSGSRLVMRASNSGANDGAYNGVIHLLK